MDEERNPIQIIQNASLSEEERAVMQISRRELNRIDESRSSTYNKGNDQCFLSAGESNSSFASQSSDQHINQKLPSSIGNQNSADKSEYFLPSVETS